MEWVSVLGALAKDICAVAACISLLVKPLRERILGLEALREGQRCLPGSEILRLYCRNHAEKKLREFEFRNLEQCHRAYHALGGNSFVDHIHREMQEWEII